jgi:diguanylate cyclase (GGDEF)-like protein/PAS domain S-box-containing protein
MPLRMSQKILLVSGVLVVAALLQAVALCGGFYAPAGSFLPGVALLVVASALPTLIAARALTRAVLDPVKKLRAAAEAVGQGNLQARVEHPSRDEFGELAAAFNEMAARLQEQSCVERALRASEQRYALAAQGTNDGLWDWDLATDTLFFSPRWKEMLGASEAEVGNTPAEWLGRVHPDDLERVRGELAAHIEGHASHFQSEHRMRHRDGAYRWMLSRGLAMRDPAGKAVRLAGSQSDITDKKTIEQQLLYEALHDGLTGLPNRALFMDRLGQGLLRAQGWRDYAFAVLFLDLDRFKVVNDSLGHQAGDRLLIEVAHRLRGCLRPDDTVARFGGDEFAILLEQLREPGDAESLCERIQRELRAPFEVSGQEVFTTASIGIVRYQPGYERPEELLRDADIAMYCAKSRGKARHELFDAHTHARASSLLQLEADLRRAIDGDEFEVYYQPILSAVTGEITAVEALARWRHPSRGLLPPCEFIPLAEETGLIVALGEWLLRTACAQLCEWRACGNHYLSLEVNLSALQFESETLVPLIRNALTESRIPAEALVLEITESMAMQGVHRTLETLNELRALGVEIAIDDFGTGYSSLAYLKRFPIRVLKIDRSFIRDVTRNVDDAAITASMIAMGHSLGLRIVAEGVETQEQWTLLRRQGCDEVQGYLFSRPVPAAELTRLLEASFRSDRALPAPIASSL